MDNIPASLPPTPASTSGSYTQGPSYLGKILAGLTVPGTTWKPTDLTDLTVLTTSATWAKHGVVVHHQ